MAKETYAAARERLLREAEAAGLKVQRQAQHTHKLLKAPRIELRPGEVVELGAQSAHWHPSGLSLWIDYRGMSLEALRANKV